MHIWAMLGLCRLLTLITKPTPIILSDLKSFQAHLAGPILLARSNLDSCFYFFYTSDTLNTFNWFNKDRRLYYHVSTEITGKYVFLSSQSHGLLIFWNCIRYLITCIIIIVVLNIFSGLEAQTLIIYNNYYSTFFLYTNDEFSLLLNKQYSNKLKLVTLF